MSVYHETETETETTTQHNTKNSSLLWLSSCAGTRLAPTSFSPLLYSPSTLTFHLSLQMPAFTSESSPSCYLHLRHSSPFSGAQLSFPLSTIRDHLVDFGQQGTRDSLPVLLTLQPTTVIDTRSNLTFIEGMNFLRLQNVSDFPILSLHNPFWF